MLMLTSQSSKIWLSRMETDKLQKLSGSAVRTFSSPEALERFKNNLLAAYPGDTGEEKLLRHLINLTLTYDEKHTQKP